MNRSKNHEAGYGNVSYCRRCRSISGMVIAVISSITAMVSSPFTSAALDRIATRETSTGSGVYEFYVHNGTTDPSFRPQGFNYYTCVTFGTAPDPLYNWWNYGTDDHKNVPYSDLFYPNLYDDSETRAELQLMVDAGYNTVRYFVNHYAHTTNWADIPSGAPRLRYASICNLVEGLKAAQDKGMRVILCFGFIPETYESEMPPSGAPPDLWDNTTVTAHNFNHYFLYPAAVQANAHFITDVLHWTKSRADAQQYTDLFKTVMAIDIMNEPFFLLDQKWPPFNLSGEVTFSHLTPSTYNLPDDRLALMDKAFKYWLETVTEAIKEKDPDMYGIGAFADILLTVDVTTPYSCHFAGYSNATTHVPPRVKNLVAVSNIDYVDIHLYPTNPDGAESNGYSIDADLATAEIEKAGARKSKFTDDTAINKPMLMSEYGAALSTTNTFHWQYPTLSRAIDCLVMQQLHSYDYGFSGWILFNWHELHDDISGIWNAKSDGGGAIKNLLGQYADPGQRKLFLLAGDSGLNLMWVDDKGNMVIRAGRRVSSYTEGAKPFYIKNSENDKVLETNLSQGTDWNVMMVGGSDNVTTHSACETPAYPLILFKNSSAANVFTLDDAGVINIAGDFYDIISN